MDIFESSNVMSSTQKLDDLSYLDLEALKSRLDTVRQRIVNLQNAQSPILRLPAEVRNLIFVLAMKAELHERKARCRYKIMFREPAFLSSSRQLRNEYMDVWYSDVTVWEELDPITEMWRTLTAREIRGMLLAKSEVGRLKIVTQQAHCDLQRTRENVEASKSICPRKGVVWAKGVGCLPKMRWWMW